MEEGRDRRNRNPQEGWGWGPEAAGIFSFVYPALILSPWEVFPWLELFLLSDPGNPGGLEAWRPGKGTTGIHIVNHRPS